MRKQDLKREREEFECRDFVTVKIPQNDRTKLNSLRLPAVVINYRGDGDRSYKLRETSDPYTNYVSSLVESNYSENNCRKLLAFVETRGSFEDIQNLGRHLQLPVPDSNMTGYTDNCVSIGNFGDGYIGYMPEEAKGGHVLLRTSGVSNNCLYNSASLAVYGDEAHAALFRLGTCVHGAVHCSQFVEKVLNSIDDEEVYPWVVGATTDKILQIIDGTRNKMEAVFKKEIVKTAGNTDAGPVQLLAFSSFLRRPLHVSTTQATEIIGSDQPGQPLWLCRVPMMPTQGLLNNFSPIVEKPLVLIHLHTKTCRAFDFLACHRMEMKAMVTCITCKRWMHDACYGYEGRGGYIECGCQKLWPIKRKSVHTFESKENTIALLRQNKAELKEFIYAIYNEVIPSWRMKDFTSSTPSVKRNLQARNGVRYLEENVSSTILDFIRNSLPIPVNPALCMDVLLPEVVVWLFSSTEGISRLEAEIILIQC